jgi:hypothetical protein
MDTSPDQPFRSLGQFTTTHAILGLILRSRVHVIANFVQVLLDVLVDAMLEAPLDKGELSHGGAMRRLGDRSCRIRFRRFVKDVRATTKRIKKESVLALKLILLVQIGIHN